MFDWWGRTKFSEWPWTGLSLSIIYIALVYSLPCLGGGYCNKATKSAENYNEATQTLIVLCTQSKCTASQEKPNYQQHESCGGLFCMGWSVIGRYFVLIGDDPVALFTALLFASTTLLWWVTHRTLRHSEESSKRELRAYVAFTISEAAKIIPNPDGYLVIPIVFDNRGQTPAVKVTSGANFDILDWPAPIPFPEPTFEETGSIYVIHPGKVNWNTPVHARRKFSEAEVATAIEGRTKRFFLWGEIRYSDIFGDEHFTRFRMMSGVEPKTNFLTLCREGNETDD